MDDRAEREQGGSTDLFVEGLLKPYDCMRRVEGGGSTGFARGGGAEPQ